MKLHVWLFALGLVSASSGFSGEVDVGFAPEGKQNIEVRSEYEPTKDEKIVVYRSDEMSDLLHQVFELGEGYVEIEFDKNGTLERILFEARTVKGVRTLIGWSDVKSSLIHIPE